MSNIFGKFTHYNTIIHKSDPRIKIFGLILIMVICFLPYGNNYMNQLLILAVLGLFIFLTMIIAKINFLDLFKSLKMIWFMAIFLLIINVFIPYGNNEHPMIIFSNGYTLYWEGLLNTFMVLFRLILMIALTMILTSTTSPMDITYGFEWFMMPLKLIKFPTQVVAMTMSLALRFIPTLLEEANRIMKAQKSRGVDYQHGFLMKKLKYITTLIIPLLISCFSISDDLSLAMEARGYDPYSKRSRYRILKFSHYDLIVIIVLLLIVSFFIFIAVISNHYGINIIETLFPLTKGVTF